jgi:hypothetical protein
VGENKKVVKRYMINRSSVGGKYAPIFIYHHDGCGLTLLTMGCGGKRAAAPQDFSLSFYWDTGSLPPQYRYEYVITIGPGTQGELDFIPGYGNAESSDRWVTSFEIASEALEDVYAFFVENGLLRSRWKTSRGLIGGSSTAIILKAFGKETHIPSISELEGDDKQLIEQAMDVIRGVVPASVWDEMNLRQMEFEDNYQY